MSLLYRVSQPLVRTLLDRMATITVVGKKNVPASGPFVLIPNHQSILDPFLVQAHCPRIVHSMTKSTQFASGPSRYFLVRSHAFPVRRYRTDAQTVRVALRTVAAGEGVCIYPEGERSWDGALQPFRRGTLRLLLRAGVPVIPVGIDGSYDVWPRWSERPRRGQTVALRFGTAIQVNAFTVRAAREAAVPEFEETLRSALLELSGESARSMEPVTCAGKP